MDHNLKIIGMASGIGAGIRGAELGVWDMFYNIKNLDSNLSFSKIFYNDSIQTKLEAIEVLSKFFKELHQYLLDNKDSLIKDETLKYLFFSGDHSNGFGIWSALSNLYQEDMGLIWIDAHLDSHNSSTTPSGNVHGMPLRMLVGEGDERLTSLHKYHFKPENICFIGTRDYEDAEIEFITKNNIKAYFMQDITSKNINAIVQEALERVSKNVKHFGISFDIDSLDPKEAPATGCYTPQGLLAKDILCVLEKVDLKNNSKFLGLEITEYNPLRDDNFKTRDVIYKLVDIVFKINKEK